MLALLVILAVLLAVTIWMPGTAGRSRGRMRQFFPAAAGDRDRTGTLVTKEVYTSLLAGILAGGLLYSNFNPGR